MTQKIDLNELPKYEVNDGNSHCWMHYNEEEIIVLNPDGTEAWRGVGTRSFRRSVKVQSHDYKHTVFAESFWGEEWGPQYTTTSGN